MDNEHIIRVILRARDEMTATLAKARAEVAAFQDSINKNQMSLFDAGDVKKVNEFTEATKKATVAQKDQDVQLNKSAATTKRYWEALKPLREQHEKLNKALRDGKADRQQMVFDLDRLAKKIETTARSFDIGSLQTGALLRMRKEIRDTIKEYNDYDKSVRRANNTNNSAANSTKKVTNELSRFRGALKGISKDWEEVNRESRRADTRFREIAITLLVANFQGFVTILQSMGGAFIALAGSAEQAGFAIAGAFTSAAAQAIPAMGLLLLTAQRLTAIFKVIQQVQAEQQAQAVQGQQQANKEARTSNTLANAHQAVADAQLSVLNAQRNLTAARRDAARQLQDLILAENQAKLAAQGAVLSEADAESALRSAISAGATAREIQQRQLAVKQAQLGVTQARQESSRGGEDLGLARQGAPGFDQLRQAQEAVKQAQQSLVQARRGVENAKNSANFAADAGLTAARKLAFLESQLSETEKKLFTTLNNIVKLYNDPKGPVRAITDIIVGAFQKGADQTLKALNDPKFLAPFKTLAHSIANAIGSATDTFFSPEVQENLKVLTEEAAKNLPVIAKALNDLFRTFLNIARGYKGVFRDIVNAFGDWASKFRKNHSDMDKLKKQAQEFEDHLKAWARLAKAVFGTIQALLSAGAPSGKGLVNDLTDAFNGWTDWINKHPKEIKKFFDDSIIVLKQLAATLGVVAVALGALFNPDTAQAFLDLVTALVPAFQLAAEAAGTAAGALSDLLNLPVAGDILLWGAALLIFNRLLFNTPKLIAEAIAKMFGFTSAGAAVAAMVKNLIFTVRLLALAFGTATTIGILGAIIAVIAILVILEKKFHIFEKLFEIVKDVINATIEFIKDHWPIIAIVLLGPFGIVLVGIVKHWDAIKKAVSTAINAILDFIKKHWQLMVALLLGPFGLIALGITKNFDKIKELFTGLFDGLKDIVKSGWKAIAKIFSGAFHGILDGLRGFGSGFVSIFAAIGDGIADAFSDGLGFAYKTLVNFINGAISAFNKVGGLLGHVGIHVPHLQKLPETLEALGALRNANRGQTNTTTSLGGSVGGDPHIDIADAFAKGGVIPATGGGRIIRAGEAGFDEIILTTDPKHRERTGNLLGQFLGKMGNFASGGWISDLPSRVSLNGVHAGVLNAARSLFGRFPELYVSSSTGGNHVKDSYHYRGQALDIAGSKPTLDKAAAWIKSSGMAHSLAEGIHNPNLAVKYGRTYAGAGPFGSVWANHLTHIHLAVAGALGRVVSDVSSTIKDNLKPVNTKKVGLFGPLVNYLRKRMAKGLEKIAGDRNDGDTPPSGVPLSGNKGENRSLAHRMVNDFFGADQWRSYDALEMQEAGYNQFARNPTSGAFGIPQALPPTKMNRAAQRGNVVEQIKWMLNYIKDRYGTPDNAWQGYWGRGGWYDQGGELPGPRGEALPIVAHAGEWILNNSQQSKIAHAMGTGRDKLKNWLGFSGGPTSFAGGGDVGSSGGLTIGKGGPLIYRIPPTDVAGSLEVIRTLTAILHEWANNGKKFAKRFAAGLTATAEELERLSTNIDDEQKARTTHIAKLSFIRKKGGIILRANQVKIAELELLSLGAYEKDLQAARRVAVQTRNRINERIRSLRKNGLTGAEKEEVAQLKGARTATNQSIANIDEKIAQNIADIYAKQQEVFQAQMDSELKPAGLRQAAIDLATRVASTLGNKGQQNSLLQDTIDNNQAQIDILKRFLVTAQSRGDTDMVEKLQAQIGELQASIVETTAQLLQNAIDAVNNEATKALAEADRTTRRAGIRQAAGDSVGAAQQRAGAIGAQGAALRNQQAGLLGLLQTAQAEGNVGVVDTLTQQLADLQVSIEENSQAQSDAAVAIKQASIDLIKSISAFRTGIFSSLQTIVNTVGSITGQLDQGRLRSLINATITTLSTAGTGLTQKLFEIFGIDLRNLHGLDLVTAIQGINLDESGFTEAQKQQFESLIQAIIENESSLLQNTLQLKELNSTLVQNFSSDQWLAFRQAVFNGSGGLMPQYQLAVPALASGGIIERSGLAYVHMGEQVVAKVDRTKTGAGSWVQNINITEPMEVADPIYLGNKIAFETALGKVNQ